MLPRAFDHIFNDIATADPGVTRFLVRASFLEIYNEEIRDLLTKDPKATGRCDLKEHPQNGVYVKDLSAFVVKGVDYENIDSFVVKGVDYENMLIFRLRWDF